MGLCLGVKKKGPIWSMSLLSGIVSCKEFLFSKLIVLNAAWALKRVVPAVNMLRQAMVVLGAFCKFPAHLLVHYLCSMWQVKILVAGSLLFWPPFHGSQCSLLWLQLTCLPFWALSLGRMLVLSLSLSFCTSLIPYLSSSQACGLWDETKNL